MHATLGIQVIKIVHFASTFGLYVLSAGADGFYRQDGRDALIRDGVVLREQPT
jgi:hypothetical protein